MNKLALAVLCVLGLVMEGAQAQVWKCKNIKTGQIEYSDIQCDGKRTAAATIDARPNELDSSGSRDRVARKQQREQNEEFQRRVEALRRQANEAGGSGAGGGNEACASAESAYERAKANRAAPATMQALKAQVNGACGRPPASARAVAPRPNIPANITNCDEGGCWDTNGTRYNGSGSTYFGSNGRTCQRIGTQMQCN